MSDQDIAAAAQLSVGSHTQHQKYSHPQQFLPLADNISVHSDKNHPNLTAVDNKTQKKHPLRSKGQVVTVEATIPLL